MPMETRWSQSPDLGSRPNLLQWVPGSVHGSESGQHSIDEITYLVLIRHLQQSSLSHTLVNSVSTLDSPHISVPAPPIWFLLDDEFYQWYSSMPSSSTIHHYFSWSTSAVSADDCSYHHNVASPYMPKCLFLTVTYHVLLSVVFSRQSLLAWLYIKFATTPEHQPAFCLFQLSLFSCRHTCIGLPALGGGKGGGVQKQWYKNKHKQKYIVPFISKIGEVPMIYSCWWFGLA